jgi:hypothetical protein
MKESMIKNSEMVRMRSWPVLWYYSGIRLVRIQTSQLSQYIIQTSETKKLNETRHLALFHVNFLNNTVAYESNITFCGKTSWNILDTTKRSRTTVQEHCTQFTLPTTSPLKHEYDKRTELSVKRSAELLLSRCFTLPIVQCNQSNKPFSCLMFEAGIHMLLLWW